MLANPRRILRLVLITLAVTGILALVIARNKAALGITEAPPRTNVALAANGGSASASSVLTYNGNPFPASRAIDGDRRGLNYVTGGVWQSSDQTLPQWLQVDFQGSKTIDEIDLFMLQNNYASPDEPTESMTFTWYGLTAFEVQYWNGSAWVTVSGGSVTGNNKVWKKLTFSPVTTSKIRVLTSASPDGWSRIAEVEAWGTIAPSRTNVALAANGGSASASSVLTYNGNPFPASKAIDGDRRGVNYLMGGTWQSSTATSPQWLQVEFNGNKTIDEIDLFMLQDNYANPSDPTDTLTFSWYGLTAFEVQYWNGSSWINVPGGSVTSNTKVWRKLTFSPLTTTKIRVLASASGDGHSRLAEVEAWEALPRANVALPVNGGAASASSNYSDPAYGYTPAAAINDERKGSPSSSNLWHDAAPGNTFSDWLQVDFNGVKTIDEVDVFTLQDNYASPSEPTEAMTFSLYGLTGFEVQYWNGSSWVTVPGGSVTGNNKVWRKFTFSPIPTTKIRVLTNASADGFSRITEVEAWQASSGTPGIKTDRAVYPEPPLPTLPSAGGKFTDPVFGTQIMRATDATDYPAPGCSTFYSHWPTFNADNTRILIRCGDSGDMKIKAFDPVNFTLGATLRTSPTLPGGVALDWQGATWSRTDPDLIFVHVSYYNASYPATGMKLYTYRPSTDTFTLIKDFAPELAPGQPDFLFEMHVDAHDEMFTLMHRRVGLSEPIYYIVWKRSTNTVLRHIPNTLTSFGPKEIANAAVPDKSGRWIFFPYNLDAGAPQIGDLRIKVLDMQTNTWQTIYWTGADDTPSHGDVGTGFMVGHGNFSGAANFRSLMNVNSRTLLFDYKNANGVTDWSNDQHMTLYADDESWVMMGLYDDPALDSYPALETGAFEDEIMQYSTIDPQKFRRLLHHRSEIKNTTGTNGYWAIPKPTISHDGRFIAFTSNWEDSGRYDLFIAKIEPPNQ